MDIFIYLQIFAYICRYFLASIFAKAQQRKKGTRLKGGLACLFVVSALSQVATKIRQAMSASSRNSLCRARPENEVDSRQADQCRCLVAKQRSKRKSRLSQYKGVAALHR